MIEAITYWLEAQLIPALELWSQENSLGVGAALILCVLFGGQLARMTMKLPTRSLQGKIALSHLVFFVTGVTLTRCLMDVSWVPALQGALAVLVLWIPSYLLGVITEKTEASAKQLGQGQGMRERVLEEIRLKQYDDEVFQAAEARAAGDEKKLRHYYIGMRSRKLGKLEQMRKPGAKPKRPHDKDARIEFELHDPFDNAHTAQQTGHGKKPSLMA